LSASKSNTALVWSSSPLIWKAALSSSPVPATNEKVWVAPVSGSVAVRSPTAVPTGWFSATVDGESARSVGASLASVIVIVNCSSTKRPPASVVRTRIE
jgi:hypothetical protein